MFWIYVVTKYTPETVKNDLMRTRKTPFDPKNLSWTPFLSGKGNFLIFFGSRLRGTTFSKSIPFSKIGLDIGI